MKKFLLLLTSGLVFAACSSSRTATSSPTPLAATPTPFPISEIKTNGRWQQQLLPKYDLSFDYPNEAKVVVNEKLSSEDFYYLDVMLPGNTRLAEIRIFKKTGEFTSPQGKAYQVKNALGNGTGYVTYIHSSDSPVEGPSFNEYAVLYKNRVYVMHWFGPEEKSQAEKKFAGSFSFGAIAIE